MHDEMNEDEFLKCIKEFVGRSRARMKMSSGLITINKKKTFRIELFMHRSGQFGFFAAGKILKRTKYGGYMMHKKVLGKTKVIGEIQECIKWPEVEKTSKKFDRDQIIQNIIARELIPHLEKARITCLASNEDEICDISSYSFQSCQIGPTKTRICWKDPSSCGRFEKLVYDMRSPSFDPDLLIETITQFSKKVVEIRNDLNKAWEETKNLWERK